MTIKPSELVVGSSNASVQPYARNMVGMPILCATKTKEHHKHDSDDDDDADSQKKREAMDRLRKVSPYNWLLPFVVQFVCYIMCMLSDWFCE